MISEKRIMLLKRTRPLEHTSNVSQIESMSRDLAPPNVHTPRVGVRGAGALAVGALAIGALAIGAVAIGRLVIGRARIRRLEIDELGVGRLRVTDTLETPSASRTQSDKVP